MRAPDVDAHSSPPWLSASRVLQQRADVDGKCIHALAITSYSLSPKPSTPVDSIRSIKSNVDYVAVVYQTVSNFGQFLSLPSPPLPSPPLSSCPFYCRTPKETDEHAGNYWNPKPQTLKNKHQKRQTNMQGTTGTMRLPKSLTKNPKTQTPNPKPQTLDPRP